MSRLTGPTHHPRTPGHRLRRTMHCFPAAYGGVRPLRARLRHAATARRPGVGPPARGTPASPGTTTHLDPGPDRSTSSPSRAHRQPDQFGRCGGPPAADARAAGGYAVISGFARLHGIDRLVGLLLLELRLGPASVSASAAGSRRQPSAVSGRLSGLVSGLSPGSSPEATRDHSAAETASPPSAGCQTISPASFSTHSPSAHSSP